MNKNQRDRYSRHINLSEIGERGQDKLLESRCLIVGMGGLGSAVALYLAAAGVGNLVLADFDCVEASNLQRQIAHHNAGIGQLKTHSARQACLAINPDIKIETIDYVLDNSDLDDTVAQFNIVVDGSDNFPTRFAVNAACVRHQVPLISGAAIKTDGQISVFRGYRADAPCYRCLFKEDTGIGETCDSTGVLGPIVGIVGTLQATEALKVLLDIGRDLSGRMLLLDGLAMEWQEIRIKKDPNCPVCARSDEKTSAKKSPKS